MSLAHFIDHTVLKPTTCEQDVERVCEEATRFGFAAVCIPPYFVSLAKEFLSGSPVGIATVLGFPFGYSHYKAKLAEASHAIESGAGELDVVMNLAAFKNGDRLTLENEILDLAKLTEGTPVIIKQIIESGILKDEEIINCCEFYSRFPLAFLKTSTGYAERGASVKAVKLMRQHLPQNIQIKASGGIKNLAFARDLIAAGATRLGCSASLDIVKEETERSNLP